jgi:hypothetical protein
MHVEMSDDEGGNKCGEGGKKGGSKMLLIVYLRVRVRNIDIAVGGGVCLDVFPCVHAEVGAGPLFQ